MADRTPLERRLRRVVVALAMLCAVLVLVVAAVLVYWKLYLLSPSADPFSRGPFVVRVGGTSADLAWSLPGDRRVELVATAPDGTTAVAHDGRFTGLEPGVRYLWTASIGGVGRAAARSDGTDRSAGAGHVRRHRRLRLGHRPRVGGRAHAGVGAPDFVVTAGDNSYLVARRCCSTATSSGRSTT